MLDPHPLPEWRALIDVPPRPAWMLRAKCRGMDASVFHPEGFDAEGRARAMAVCEACPVRVECLDHALRHNERIGVWGGTNARQRRVMAGPPPRTRALRRQLITDELRNDPQRSDGAIGRQLGVSPNTVTAVRRAMTQAS